MLTKQSLIDVLQQEPQNQFEVAVEDLNDEAIDWVEVSKLASRNAFIRKKLTKSSDGGLDFVEDQVVFLRKGKEA